MVKKFSNDAESAPGAALFERFKESSTQIWLAGLGAFAKAQEEGNKVFEALVKQGSELQRKLQRLAAEQFDEVSQDVSARMMDATNKAQGAWDRLEAVFEERVSRAVNRLGVPTRADIAALAARVEALSEQVARLKAALDQTSRTAPAARARTAQHAKSSAKSRAKGASQ
ncbi:MAG: phasin family protein [Casimicrobiaceae bacterium]|nr:phasin family protein [Casimicrobiaceae bacterium]